MFPLLLSVVLLIDLDRFRQQMALLITFWLYSMFPFQVGGASVPHILSWNTTGNSFHCECCTMLPMNSCRTFGYTLAC